MYIFGRVKAIDPSCIADTLEDNVLYPTVHFFCAVLNVVRYSAVSNSLYHSYYNILRIDTSYNIIRL